MRIVAFAELDRRYGIPLSARQLDRLSRAGLFPPKIRLSRKSAGYSEADIEAWLAERAAQARASVGESA